MTHPTERMFRARIDVRLDAAVNDPQGNAVREGLRSLGHDDVRDVRIGKIVELTLAAVDEADAQERVARMCQELLANPVIESYELEIAEVA